MLKTEKPREIAARILQHRAGGDFIEDLLERNLASAKLSLVDRHLCQQLVYGVVRWEATLDWLIARKTSDRPQKPMLRTVLRLALFQLFWMDRIPDHAAVHESVEMVKNAGYGQQAGFINAVLRSYLREEGATREHLAALKQTQPAIGYSHPEWLAKRWTERWGAEAAAALMGWDNIPPKTFARINTFKTEPARLLDQWRNENVQYDFFNADWVAENLVFELKDFPPLHKLPSFQQGLFYVQDPSTLLAVHMLAAQPGESILDACAAPGGKLTAIAQAMRNEGILVAQDLTEGRLKMIDENCSRLGAKCVTTTDARTVFRAGELFDRVLLDAPCSNTGVMRRRVDLRWRVRAEELLRLAQGQRELLASLCTLLRPGGLLIYSTCSLEPEENRQLVEQFLVENPHFILDADRELTPMKEKVDGAYVARLKRVS